ncbi:MAG: DNA recombination protein RmuC [Dokdonella sp.]
MSEQTTTYLLLAVLLGGALGALLLAAFGRRWARQAAEDALLRSEPERVMIRQQRDNFERQTVELRMYGERVDSERMAIEHRLQAVATMAAERRAEAEQLTRQLADLHPRHDEAMRALQVLGGEHAALKASATEQARSAAEKLAMLDHAEQRLRESFQNLANQILEAKAERFKEQNAEALGGLLDPLKLQLKEFRETVTQTHASEQRERGMLTQEIRTLKELNQQISLDAINLTRALKGDTRSQGAWGELVLERVLEASGLQAGREYETQSSFTDAEGVRQRPDVIVRLPEDKIIVVDSKMSLVAWERAVAAIDDSDREIAMREHLQSLRRHIDGLSSKNYADIDELRSLDFVLLFVPVEAAFIEAVRADANLYTYALGRNISLVSPSTLLATLRTVAHLWRIERRNVNAVEIARRAAQLHDNFVLLVNELDNIGSQLDKAQNAHRSATRRLTEGGKGSVLLQVQSLAEMGAPTRRTLPANLLDVAGALESDEFERQDPSEPA